MHIQPSQTTLKLTKHRQPQTRSRQLRIRPPYIENPTILPTMIRPILSSIHVLTHLDLLAYPPLA